MLHKFTICCNCIRLWAL